MIPYDKKSGKIWYNNELVDWADAKIHILNHGLHYASCVFEGERVYENSIFKLEEHTSRLFYSAKRMGMTIPYTEEEINDACKEIISSLIKSFKTLFKLCFVIFSFLSSSEIVIPLYIESRCNTL